MAREKAGSSEFTNNGTSRGISLSEEIRKLDAMTGGSSSGEIPLISIKPLQTKRMSSKPQQVSSTTSADSSQHFHIHGQRNKGVPIEEWDGDKPDSIYNNRRPSEGCWMEAVEGYMG
jgi:hypothetical protein